MDPESGSRKRIQNLDPENGSRKRIQSAAAPLAYLVEATKRKTIPTLSLHFTEFTTFQFAWFLMLFIEIRLPESCNCRILGIAYLRNPWKIIQIATFQFGSFHWVWNLFPHLRVLRAPFDGALKSQKWRKYSLSQSTQPNSNLAISMIFQWFH